MSIEKVAGKKIVTFLLLFEPVSELLSLRRFACIFKFSKPNYYFMNSGRCDIKYKELGTNWRRQLEQLK